MLAEFPHLNNNLMQTQLFFIICEYRKAIMRNLFLSLDTDLLLREKTLFINLITEEI